MTITASTTTTTTETTFRLRPIDAMEADRLRAGWADSPVYVADEKPGFPCRQCLRDAEIGDELLLVSHDPFIMDSPYRSASPIFLHRKACSPPDDLHALPEQLTIRQLSVRAFDVNALMIDAAIVQGDHLASALDRMFDDPECDCVHVHNATRGCWAVRLDRGDSVADPSVV
jgi:Protein of unknown function (DUF1203)